MTSARAVHPVAVVTGSSSGIGAAIARRLACDGFHVVVHAGTRKSHAEEVADSIRAGSPVEATAIECDFASEQRLEHFVDECFAWRGRVDVWVNNAGADVLTGAAADEPFEKKLRHLLDVDVMGTVLLSRAAGARMQRQTSAEDSATRGLIVNMGWDQAEQGMGGDSGQMFAAAKGAIMAATRSLAKTLAPAVRVNCVAPGWIKTAWGQTASESWQRRAVAESLLERWGTPDDVAGVVSFLASRDGQFVNGQTICVNGGFRHSVIPGEP